MSSIKKRRLPFFKIERSLKPKNFWGYTYIITKPSNLGFGKTEIKIT
jgi:hypothetical protein